MLAYAARFSNPFEVLPSDKQAVIQQNFDAIDRAATAVGVDPQTMQAISLVETRGGLFGVAGSQPGYTGQRSYGLMQIQPATAYVIVRNHPRLLDMFFSGVRPTYTQMVHFLVHNAYGSAYLASYLFRDYSAQLNNNWCSTVLGYNMGIVVATNARHCEQNVYVQDVRWFLTHVVKPHQAVEG
jgi:soluble lytic murein transglycosylase-like protein